MSRFFLLTILIFTACPVLAQGRAALTDHPLVSPYEGSDIRRKDVKEFDEYSAFMGMDETGKDPTGLQLEGKVTRILYTKPKERSILEVFRNYETAIEQAGAEILFSCNQEKTECAKAYAGPTLQKYSNIHSVYNLVGRYMLAKLADGDNTAYIAIAVGPSFTDIHVVEVKNMDTGMVSLDAEALGKGLDTKGYVVVEGIYFDTDKATLKTESTAALEELAKLLQRRPDLKVFVVGHTDLQGSFDHNLTLSRNRAAAVVAGLVDNYGVSRDRMEGHGVGPLAPQATNSNEAGRAQNRRVVLVAR